MDARRKACMYADDFRQNNVAIATVCAADGRRCCTLTLCVAARRSVHRQRESAHVDVNCARKPAHALNFRTRPYYFDILGRARVETASVGPSDEAPRHRQMPPLQHAGILDASTRSEFRQPEVVPKYTAMHHSSRERRHVRTARLVEFCSSNASPRQNLWTRVHVQRPDWARWS